MGRPITGRCFCGAVSFRISSAPLIKRACWCRDCQYLAAGGATINAIFASRDLELTGVTAGHVRTGDSGAQLRRSFCPACGTPLFAEDLAMPDYVVVRAGALDDPELAQPDSVIWTASAPSWACIDPDLPNFPRHVPAVLP